MLRLAFLALHGHPRFVWGTVALGEATNAVTRIVTTHYRYKRTTGFRCREEAGDITAASSIDRLEKQENIVAKNEDDPRARHAKAAREHAEAKRALARAKLEEARAEWEMVHIKTQEYLERAKRQRTPDPMTRPVPTRHWRSYGTEPLPTGQEALAEPFRAFPSWFLMAAVFLFHPAEHDASAEPRSQLRRRPADSAHHAAHRLLPRAGVLQFVPPPGRR